MGGQWHLVHHYAVRRRTDLSDCQERMLMMRETLQASTWFMAVGDIMELALTISTVGFSGLIRWRPNACYVLAFGVRAFFNWDSSSGRMPELPFLAERRVHAATGRNRQWSFLPVRCWFETAILATGRNRRVSMNVRKIRRPRRRSVLCPSPEIADCLVRT